MGGGSAGRLDRKAFERVEQRLPLDLPHVGDCRVVVHLEQELRKIRVVHLTCAGQITVAGDGDGRAVRRIDGDLHLHLPFWAPPLIGRAEAAVIGGLRGALDAQVDLVERHIDHAR